MGWIIALIVGGVAGWLASLVMNQAERRQIGALGGLMYRTSGAGYEG